MGRPFYISEIDISDIPILNSDYDLPEPYNRTLFRTQNINPAIRLGIREKWNYNSVHEISPWNGICESIREVIKPFSGDGYNIRSSWMNYYSEGNAVQWHHHIRQGVDITTLLFLNTSKTPLVLSTITTNEDFERIGRGEKFSIPITHQIDTIAGRVVAFSSRMAHMVPKCYDERWTLTTNFNRVI
jgi:hypothetical protein